MKQILQVNLLDSLTHDLPFGSAVVSAAARDGGICVWLLCDMLKRKEPQSFIVAGTEWELPDFVTAEMYIDTVFTKHNDLVWHVFALGYTSGLKPYDRRAMDEISAAFPASYHTNKLRS